MTHLEFKELKEWGDSFNDNLSAMQIKLTLSACQLYISLQNEVRDIFGVACTFAILYGTHEQFKQPTAYKRFLALIEKISENKIKKP